MVNGLTRINKLEKIRKNIITIFLLMLIVIIISSLFTTPVYAEDEEPWVKCPICGGEVLRKGFLDNYKHKPPNSDETKELGDPVSKAAFDMCCTVFGAEVLTNDGTELSAYNVLKFNTSKADGVYTNLWTTAKTYYDGFKFVGIMLAVVWALSDMFGMLSKETYTLEHLVKVLIKMVIGIAVVINGYDILSFILDYASTAFEVVATTPTSGGASSVCQFNQIADGGFVDSCILILELLIPVVILNFCKTLISILCWSRVLDIIVRVALAPIALSDITKGGLRSNAVAYLKKFLVSVIQGAVLMGIIKAYGTIASLAGSGNDWFAICILSITLIVTSVKSKEYASDIIGC